MNTSHMDAAAIAARVDGALNHDNVATRVAHFFLPDSVKFDHPGTRARPAAKRESVTVVLANANAELAKALGAQKDARIAAARLRLAGGGDAAQPQLTAIASRVAYLADVVAGLEFLAESEAQ